MSESQFSLPQRHQVTETPREKNFVTWRLCDFVVEFQTLSQDVALAGKINSLVIVVWNADVISKASERAGDFCP